MLEPTSHVSSKYCTSSACLQCGYHHVTAQLWYYYNHRPANKLYTYVRWAILNFLCYYRSTLGRVCNTILGTHIILYDK